MNKTKINIFKDIRAYLIGILIIFSTSLIAQLFMIQILPLKYNIVLTISIIVIVILMIVLQYNKKINKFNKILGKIIVIILCVALGIGNYYIYKGGDTLRSISGANLKTDAISIIVNKDAQEIEIEDLNGASIGIMKSIDRANTDKALQDIKENKGVDLSVIEFNSPYDLAEALYNDEVKAILLNEAYRGTYQDNEENEKFKNFDIETKVIYQIELHTEIEDISKNVDVTKSPFNVFISGIDTYGPVSTASRSDVNMLASINPTTHQIVLTSIPRDYYVVQSCQGGQLDKLTHAGIFGVDCSVDAVENLFGIEINYYARVNFTSLIDIVNALGGITVENPNSFVGNEGTSFQSGTITLNGNQALEFARERYSFAEGDRERGRNQMRVLTGIINKAISPSIITNYTSVMNAISNSFETNMSSGEVTKFIQKQLDTMSSWDIEQNSVNGSGGTDWTPANGFNAYVMYPDQSTIDYTKTLINQLMNGESIIN